MRIKGTLSPTWVWLVLGPVLAEALVFFVVAAGHTSGWWQVPLSFFVVAPIVLLVSSVVGGLLIGHGRLAGRPLLPALPADTRLGDPYEHVAVGRRVDISRWQGAGQGWIDISQSTILLVAGQRDGSYTYDRWAVVLRTRKEQLIIAYRHHKWIYYGRSDDYWAFEPAKDESDVVGALVLRGFSEARKAFPQGAAELDQRVKQSEGRRKGEEF